MTLAFLDMHHAAEPGSSLSESDRIVDLLTQLSQGHQSQPDEIGFVAGVLVATQSQRIRDAAALALADMNARVAGASILEVLRRPDMAASSGTLLYALFELAQPIDLETLVVIVENGSYEGRAMALRLLEDGLVELGGHLKPDEARTRLLHLATMGGESEAAMAAQTALGLLSSSDVAAG